MLLNALIISIANKMSNESFCLCFWALSFPKHEQTNLWLNSFIFMEVLEKLWSCPSLPGPIKILSRSIAWPCLSWDKCPGPGLATDKLKSTFCPFAEPNLYSEPSNSSSRSLGVSIILEVWRSSLGGDQNVNILIIDKSTMEKARKTQSYSGSL